MLVLNAYDGDDKADVTEITKRQGRKTQRHQVQPTAIGSDDDSVSDDENDMDEGDTTYLEFGTIIEGDAEEMEQDEEGMMKEQLVTDDASTWDY